LWNRLAETALAGRPITREEFRAVLHAPRVELLSLLDAAYRVRRATFGNRVQIHVLENAKLGACPEDCGFCSQSEKHGSPGGRAAIKEVEELVKGAERAAQNGARRYCMVTATRGPSQRDLDIICEATRQIKSRFQIDVCASLGLLNPQKARRLAEAGVDRFNHNLETSAGHFKEIVTTHRFEDRVATLKVAREAGMELCAGGIVGLGESEEDLVDLAFALHELAVDSVPVNFLDPRPGTPLARYQRVTPEYGLKVLCAFRFLHARADVRVAGGREVTLKSLQPLALYPANSIFSSGYLTTAGTDFERDRQMLEDLGFEIEDRRGHGPDQSRLYEDGRSGADVADWG
jgi:biotin synthase